MAPVYAADALDHSALALMTAAAALIDRPMKIVHLILTRRFAGSERYAVELANQQALEHDVSIILFRHAAQARPDAIAQHVDARVNIIWVSNFKPLALWQARRAISALQPDVCHAHLSWGCRVLKGLAGTVPVRVATLHIAYKSRQHQHLDGLIAIAPWQLPQLPPRFSQRVAQIDNWSAPPAAAVDARQRLRAELGIAADTLVFGTLGRLDPSKGVDVVIRAFQQAAVPNSRLIIVGQGNARQQLESIADQRVHFAGYCREPQNWLAGFDVFVSAARTEPFGLVLLEAMHAGLPIIASASEGATHLAEHIGRPLIPIDSVAGFSAAFRQMAQSPPGRIQYRLERFDKAARCADIVAFYQRLWQLGE